MMSDSNAAGDRAETGTLVSARGREWVVLPNDEPDRLLLKPLGGGEDEILALFPARESVTSATFALPDPERPGDAQSCALLRDAVRLGIRSTTGPFRSFGRIAVEPRPYQLVPLLMAMRQETIRLLIADDVGIGKTVESLLIARELLDRGEIRRLSVLCPPPLAEQWQKEMADKFHIDAEVVLPSTVNRLERGLGPGTSLFEVCPFTIISLEFIKSDRYRPAFLRPSPEFVSVDEAHTSASPGGGRGWKVRYELVKSLAEDPNRHMVFVTATPHSGKDDVFKSLLGFLNPEFANLPEDLSGRENEKARQRLARHFVQRRRENIERFMDADTVFPKRESMEVRWEGDKAWRGLFSRVLSLARDNVASAQEGSLWRQRVSWWSALALLRAVSSSPEAAARTLRTRAGGSDEVRGSVEDIDRLGSQSAFDLDSGDEAAISDSLPGADISPGEGDGMAAAPAPRRARYTELARLAESLTGDRDPKLMSLVPRLRELVDEGWSPVVFCRFIATAEYLAGELRKRIPDCATVAVTGQMPPAAREEEINRLAREPRRVLVCTDCLSEGINLQTGFNAVIHYDLSWNPTRHEQREGRVDRFGQPKKTVRVITWYGASNPMDEMILNVLLRKHEAIRKSLGISVPVPEDCRNIIEKHVEDLLVSGRPVTLQATPMLPGVLEHASAADVRFHERWQRDAEKERRTRSLFAHEGVRTDEIAACLRDADEAAGGPATVEHFFASACRLLGGVERQRRGDDRHVRSFTFDEHARRRAEIDLADYDGTFVFAPPARRGETLIVRTHPLVERIASHLAGEALDQRDDAALARCGVMRTKAVDRRTTLLLCRFRFRLETRGAVRHATLAEECVSLAFAGAPTTATWLSKEAARALLAATPSGNIGREQARDWIAKVERDMPALMKHVADVQQERAEELLASHRGARPAFSGGRARSAVHAQGTPDILGIFVYLPDLQGGRHG